MARGKPQRPSGKRDRKVVIRARTAYTLKLQLIGPATLDESTELAAKLNGLIATYNTLYFKNPDGTMQTPRIKAVTGSVE
jgi:hypothetical protein